MTVHLTTKELRQRLEHFVQDELTEEAVTRPAARPLEAATKAPKTKKSPQHEEAFVEDTEGVIGVGSLVRLKGQNAVGEVLSIKGKDAEVAIGDLKSYVKLNRLEKVSRREFKEAVGESRVAPKLTGIDLNEKAVNFSFNLDIRGKRGEEALVEVDNFMNDALMLGYPELRILHGKGDGILRQLIRNHLRNSYKKHVSGMDDEHADRGGAGITIVKMKG